MAGKGASALGNEVHMHRLYKLQAVAEGLKIYIVSHIIDISDVNGNE